MSEIKIEQLGKRYDKGALAVSDFNLHIKDEEFIVFVGPSGCGKSTTLRMIAGLEEISEGEFFIDGKRMNDVEPKERDIAMVFQNYALYPHMTVYEKVPAVSVVLVPFISLLCGNIICQRNCGREAHRWNQSGFFSSLAESFFVPRGFFSSCMSCFRSSNGMESTFISSSCISVIVSLSVFTCSGLSIGAPSLDLRSFSLKRSFSAMVSTSPLAFFFIYSLIEVL
ncbi:ABC transporter ATP-binding protein [Planococcus sp. CP5-4_UN]|uniref:ATP-binding cassette domain-containing protein n=1 Tax=Planococcus sp. CP5-4_UN TaxID=2850852 RepID=UPI0020B8BA1C|nr:ABC transporter ATP-binding protein [Planococcus sp. CP5-4_UN]